MMGNRAVGHLRGAAAAEHDVGGPAGAKRICGAGLEVRDRFSDLYQQRRVALVGPQLPNTSGNARRPSWSGRPCGLADVIGEVRLAGDPAGLGQHGNATDPAAVASSFGGASVLISAFAPACAAGAA
jgi:hypothetical protein